MLPMPLAKITEDFLLQVCSEEWPESQNLEFKATMPGTKNEDRDEFRKDVSALANARGGDLVFGISTIDDKAKTLLGCAESSDGAKRRLQQILETNVEPRIGGIQYHSVLITDSKHVVVLRIPQSFIGPHRVGQVSAHRFAYRDNTKTSDMTYDQLRNAFGMRESLLQRVKGFRSERLLKIARGKAPVHLGAKPKIVVHIVPIQGLVGTASLDVVDLHNKHDVFRLRDYSWHRRPNIDGLVRFPYEADGPIDQYLQIFRNGAMEVVRADQYESDKNPPAMPVSWVGHLLRDSVKAYVEAAPTVGISGPAVVSLSLIDGGQTVLSPNDRSFARQLLGEELLEIPESWVDDVTAIDLDSTSQPILDMFCQAYGERQCELYDDNGRWNER